MRWPWIIGLVASLLAARSAAPGDAVAADRVPLQVVLGLPRAPDTETLVLDTGEQSVGVVQDQAIHLRTPHGLLTFPVAVVAGIELAGSRGGQDTVVTVRSDFLQGLLEESGFQLQRKGATAAQFVRRERIRKIAFRLRPGEAQGTASGWTVRLRDGCFFHGRPRPGGFRVESSGAEIPGDDERVAAILFEGGDPLGAQVQLTSGETIKVAVLAEDVAFETDFGAVLPIYYRHIQEIRRGTDLSAVMLRQLGAPPEPASDASPLASQPDPAVVPLDGMVWIRPGAFVLGSPTQEIDRDLDEGPVTQVVIPAGFWLADHEVTQAEYERVIKSNPSQYLGDTQRPVEKVSWQEAMDYCVELTRQERAVGHLPADYAYRLPTEAEWEYACRAGTSTRFSFGDDPGYTQIKDHAWYGANSDSAPHPVRGKRPNPWGLHDMHGNLLEWCLDEWKGSLPGGAITNQVSAPAGRLRVARGGSWLYEARFSRSANRDSYGMANRCSDVGFRVALARVSIPAP